MLNRAFVDRLGERGIDAASPEAADLRRQVEDDLTLHEHSAGRAPDANVIREAVSSLVGPAGDDRLIGGSAGDEASIGDAAPERSTIRQVIEDGVSYDVETRPDGSEWLKGRSGEANGVRVMLRPAGAAAEMAPGLGAAGQSETPAAPTKTPGVMSDIGTGVARGFDDASASGKSESEQIPAFAGMTGGGRRVLSWSCRRKPASVFPEGNQPKAEELPVSFAVRDLGGRSRLARPSAAWPG